MINSKVVFYFSVLLVIGAFFIIESNWLGKFIFLIYLFTVYLFSKLRNKKIAVSLSILLLIMVAILKIIQVI
ncbi:hypothetical protein GCM10008018_13860 [Paenibacillus marchantiophytorum]|uniref:Uncharacterized protein n=1 Tax=Paenibacillus marchantiophytorum TaxID=1619310 RepID=A0ABQ2BU03_9BACL|nr:hypothetical protein GCM10008018_13860 [Paenibacillus marchantiophytorum]